MAELTAAVAAVVPAARITFVRDPSPRDVAALTWPGVGGVGFRAWGQFVRIAWPEPVDRETYAAVIDAVRPWWDVEAGFSLQGGTAGGWPVRDA